MSKFKVGDRVKLVIPEGGRPRYSWGSVRNGDIGSIAKIDSDGDLRVDFPAQKDWTATPGEIEKIQEPKTATEVMMNMAIDNIMSRTSLPRFVDPEMFWGKSLITELMEYKTPKRKTLMSSIVEKIKNLKLSETDRILRKHGFEDESGKMTEEAENMMDEEILQERWKTRREQIATDIKAVEESDKK